MLEASEIPHTTQIFYVADFRGVYLEPWEDRQEPGTAANTLKMASLELAISYAALILADEGVAITPEKIQTLLAAAKLEVEPIWAVLFAKALQGKDLKELLLNVSAGGPPGPAITEGPPMAKDGETKGQEDKKDEKKKKKKDEPKDESDEDMGFGLFD
ncbi:hypothetical protein TWF281_005701 [Arthrobotrys megalospora]